MVYVFDNIDMSICSTHGSPHQKMEHTDTSWVDFGMTNKIRPFSGDQSGFLDLIRFSGSHQVFWMNSVEKPSK